MTPSLCFVRGWAMPPRFWHRVRALLPPDIALGEAGSARPVLAVGHSLGVMQLLEAPPRRLAGLVAINGFSRLARAADHPDGIDPRILRRMAQRLRRQPAATVLDFHAVCGLPTSGPEQAQENLPCLAAGLRLLQDGDGRGALAALSVPVLAIAGGRDAIAPPALARACFSGLRPLSDRRPALRWVEQGGHVLPVTHPEACVAVILELLDTLR
nr:alpha/beta hydrolase [uncultured Lichenicoccus sp.]